ncbi:hypothetical protein QTP88_001108 [Uroleucon formosanum]
MQCYLVRNEIGISTNTFKRKLETIALDFESNANFPHCIGAVDGKHIRIICPSGSGSMYYNYKQYNSLVLMAIADSNYLFVYVNIGSYGKDCDFAIFKRNLWDQRTKNYHNRDRKTPAWNAVGEKLNVDGTTAQKMWQNLRDSYRRKLKTRLEKKSGDGAKRDDNWPYFEAMDFLRNVLTPRESSGNIPSVNYENLGDKSTVDSPADISNDEDNNIVDVCNVTAEPNTLKTNFENDSSDEVLDISQTTKNRNQKPNKPTEKKGNKRGLSDNDKFLEIESKKLQILSERFSKKPEKKEDDADTHFVLSLLEPMKELSSLEKMRVKSDIMNLLTRALENKADQRPSAGFLVSPSLSVNTNYSGTSVESIGPMEETSRGDNFAQSFMPLQPNQFPTTSENQYNHHMGFFNQRQV